MHGDRRITYRDLVSDSKRLAAGSRRSASAPLDRVVMQLPNVPEFVTTYFALNRIGAIPVMALRAHRHAEVRHFMRASGATAYVIARRARQLRLSRDGARDAGRTSRHCATCSSLATPAAGQTALADVLERSMSDAESTRNCVRCGRDPTAVATMLLSGGTTSMSKLIPRTHDDYVLNARLCGAVAGFDRETVFMAILPLGHNYNLASPGMLGAFYHGGTVVLAPSTNADDVFALVERERVTVIAAVVPLISNWLNSNVGAALRPVVAARRAERRRPPGARAARTAARAASAACRKRSTARQKA